MAFDPAQMAAPVRGGHGWFPRRRVPVSGHRKWNTQRGWSVFFGVRGLRQRASAPQIALASESFEPPP